VEMTPFYKYHGAGNDFLMIDNRRGIFDIHDKEKIKLWCHRRFGIGADGILTLEQEPGYDFKMQYINSDGSMGAMCGNGGRCIVHFANSLGLIRDPKKIKFLAVDGEHNAEILPDGLIKLKMRDVENISERNGLPYLYSGTAPHNIVYVDDVKNFPVVEEGRRIRNLDKEGLNVNFVEVGGDILKMRTYERGVEDETLACGTGATCVAIASHHLGKISGNSVKIKMPGGDLKIEFEKTAEGKYQNIWLIGPATEVFKGEISL